MQRTWIEDDGKQHSIDERELSSHQKVLPQWFYDRPTTMVACDLLGKVLVHETKKGRLAGVITEVEAYLGVHDHACHANYGPTPKKSIFYEADPGTVYVFRTRAHHCLNILTGGDTPLGCVLIRAADPLFGIETMRKRRGRAKDRTAIARGPGNLSSAFWISMALNHTKATEGPIKIMDFGLNGFLPMATPRIGINVGATYPFRYYIQQNPSVSKIRSK